jgi:hypothetical protein
MIGILLALTIIAAVGVLGMRRWQRTRTRRRQPGVTIYRPIVVGSFDEIDAVLQGRTCWCGGICTSAGETSRSIGDRRYRIARVVCPECEREQFLYFDVTQALQ